MSKKPELDPRLIELARTYPIDEPRQTLPKESPGSGRQLVEAMPAKEVRFLYAWLTSLSVMAFIATLLASAGVISPALGAILTAATPFFAAMAVIMAINRQPQPPETPAANNPRNAP